MPNEATWLEIERAYVDSDEPLASISRHYKIATSSIHRRAKTYGWPRRRSHPARVAVTVDSLAAARNAVARQLYRRMSQRLEQMERGTAAGGDRPTADDPDDRMLTALIRQFEKLTGLDGISERERGSAKGRERRPDAGAGDKSIARQLQPTPADAARLREEIVSRLERLHEQERKRSASK